MIVERFPDRTIQVEGKDYLYFGGTAYLGLPTNRDFQSTLTQCLLKWGSFYGSSRNSNIKLSVFNRVEDFFAKQIGTEDSVTTSSGTLAGRLILEYLSKSDYVFYHYPKTHPAILHNNSLPLFIDDKLNPSLLNNLEENIVITADSVLALEVKPTSFDFLNDISSKKRITLVVDESHSLGIVGKNGKGIFNTIPNEKLVRKIMISSLGKALGLSGGIIASDKKFIDSIKKEELFISSSCANAAYLEAYLLSQDLIKVQQQKLKENLEFLFKDLNLNSSFTFNKNYPIIYCNDKNFYKDLFNNNIIITNFKYPNYKGLMNRIVITANHTKEDLENLKQVLKIY
ncbi:aminotransferase class I/II-fold pyridoxal phosphate-dependent enzyme [Gaetbulibacter sp. M235]|uniref:aminotransferase class I/II-fold pyridoxal phosphate-dependent enzyme n=1 Tax=Gaetbulibacter sp. M235 TaxID=3126510 RepID=UPI00374E9BAE